ncbi:MAG TPA: Ig-like domain-containing protein, partial [Pseudosphingobacterium sp.]|nr:Ig-like domain-containing protein [Pseudosphingobacterium sp.]
NGTVTVNPDGTVEYTPNPGYTGPDTFEYTVDDEEGNPSNPATVTVRVNEGPTAIDDSTSTNPGTPVTIPVLANDKEKNSPLDVTTVKLVDPLNGDLVNRVTIPNEGVYEVNSTTGGVTFTPEAGFTGVTTPVQYRVEDQNGGLSNPATITVTVNEGPTAVNDSTSTNPGTPVTIPVLTNDTPGDSPIDPSTVTITTPPTHGTVTVNPNGTVIYTPEPGYSGPDEFEYTVDDENGVPSNPAKVVVTVNPPVTPPTAVNDNTSTNPGTPVTIPVLTNDTPGASPIDPSTVTITTPPTHGTVTVNPNGTVIYTPEPGYTGPDEFEYTVDDENGVPSNPAKVVVTVNPPVTPPTADDDETTTDGDTPVIIPILDNDTEGTNPIDPSKVKITRPPVHGTVEVKPDGTIVYTPAPGYTGPDEFEYTVDDANGVPSNPAKVKITVNAGPKAIDDEATTMSAVPVKIAILNNDEPGSSPLDVATVEIVNAPQNGTVTVNPDGTVTYTSNKGYLGTDRFTYRVKDQRGLWTNVANVVIEVTANPLFIPNFFTPNGDGQNDVFEIVGIEAYDRVELFIFNRWGDEVYNNPNYINNWDGSNLNEGTYYYLVKLRKEGREETMKGWVLLKKQ